MRGNGREVSVPGDYSGYSLTAHIIEWTNKRYGDRLKVDYTVGKTIFTLQGDVWLLSLPLLMGSFVPLQVFDLSVDPEIIRIKIEGQSHPAINILRYIDGLSQEMALALSAEECSDLAGFFAHSYYFFDRLDQLKKSNQLAHIAVLN